MAQASGRSTRPARSTLMAWSAVGLLGLAYSAVALAVALGPGRYSTYAARSPAVATAAGLALVGAAVAAARGPAGRRVATLAVAAACCWSAPVWVGWSDGPGLVRGLGALAAPYLVPVVLHWVLTTTSARPSVPGRALLAVGYASATCTALGEAVLRDPLDDPDCWDNCVSHVFLVSSQPGLLHGLESGTGWVLVLLGVAQVLVSLVGIRSPGVPRRRRQWPVVAGGALTGGALAVHAVLAEVRTERPTDPAFERSYVALALGMLLLSAGPVLALLRSTAQRREVSRIAAELGAGPQPGHLERALGRAVGDPGLSIAYWLPSALAYVDGHGREVAPPVAGAGNVLTTLLRDGQPLATIRHAPSVGEAMRNLGAGTRLAFDNERLRAELLSQAEHIQASRERLVEAGDAGRHRLERDLHDGAQQRLLALSYHLRLALAAAESEGDTPAVGLLGAAVEESLEALQELRVLAHGIYPAILAEAGLGPAVADLSDTAAVPMTIALVVGRRMALPVETAAYAVVREALDDAVARSATTVDVHVACDEDRLVILVRDDGATRRSPLVSVADRVGALGGTLRETQGALRAELPCG